MGQVVPTVWEPGDTPGLLSDRAVTQVREGTRNSLRDPRVLLLPLGPPQKKVRYFPRRERERVSLRLK